MKTVILINLLIVAIVSTAAFAAEDEISLGDQLKGLPPSARIAYVRHLIGQGRDDAEVFFQLAVAFHESSLADSAILYYGMAIERDPDSFKSYVNLGVLYDDMGEVVLAEKNFLSAVSVNPDDVLANSHLAFMVFQQKKYDKAWEYLSRALEIDPDHPQPRFYLAIFFWESRMYREALAEWERVVELAPGSYLGARAKENIVMLQNALNSPTQSGVWTPKR